MSNTAGLTLEEGLSFEYIIERLNTAGIKFKVEVYPDQNVDRNFFRSSLIIVRNKKANKLAKLILGEPEDERHESRPRGMNALHYYATYTKGPSFDESSLDGRITYNKGRLVELTTLKAFF